jgi:very-short-patch-repair endonuclease
MHLTFAENRSEMRLSRALTAVGIRHIRLFCFYKNWQADFAWPDQKLMVEVDGAFHQNCSATKERDKRKTRKAKALGFRILRVSTMDVETKLPTVVRAIAQALGHALPVSLQ